MAGDGEQQGKKQRAERKVEAKGAFAPDRQLGLELRQRLGAGGQLFWRARDQG
jgi:hypothetical protein